MLPSTPRRRPFYADPSFRYLVTACVFGLGAIGVYLFELQPALDKRESKRIRAENLSGRPAYVPTPAGAEVDVRFDGILSRVKDFTEPEDRGEPYGRLLRYLGTVEPKALQESSVFVDYPLFAQHAADLRGRSVRVLGLFLGSDPLRVSRDGFGVDFVHRAYVATDLNLTDIYVFDTLEPPPAGIRKGSVVQADALFLKMTSYVGQGNKTVTYPMLLGTKFRLIRETVEVDSTAGTMVIVVSALSVMAVIYFSIRLWSRPKPPRIVGTAIPR